MNPTDPAYANAEWQVPALRERIAFLEERITDLQFHNTQLQERARFAAAHADERLRSAALNVYKLDWVWAHRTADMPERIGSKFWVSLRDALGLKERDIGNKWSPAQQRSAIELVESTSPTKLMGPWTGGVTPAGQSYSAPVFGKRKVTP